MPRVSTFAAASPLTGTEIVPLVQGGSDVRSTASAIAALAAAATVNVNAQTGTSYTVVSGDRSKLVTFSNAAAIAVTLPVATTFGAGWFCFVQNRGAGLVTVTPTTSTIDGASALNVATNQGVLVASDGTNYYTMRGTGRVIVVSVAYAATVTVDLSAYAAYTRVVIDITLLGDVTFNLTNGADAQSIEVRVRQDATGSRIWTSGANLRMSADITSIVLSTAASKLDKLLFEWVGADGKADINAINKGF